MFGDRNLLTCYLILLSILLDNICITEYLTMTLGTAPPTQTSDYEMVQLEHSTKLCHTRHTDTLFLGEEC
jgi:hypothetical protein